MTLTFDGRWYHLETPLLSRSFSRSQLRAWIKENHAASAEWFYAWTREAEEHVNQPITRML